MIDTLLPALSLTAKLAAATTVCLLLLGTPLAWWLARWRHRAKPLLEALVALPLILPPTVLGFYLLVAFAPGAWLGGFWQWAFDAPLAFSFTGLLIGSIIYSLPFVVQPLQAAFEQFDQTQWEAAALLGAGPWDRFLHIVLPQVRSAFVIAACLGFAHTVGEFGVVLMIGGNIPGETQVLSILLYEEVEALNYAYAHRLALGLVVFSLVLLWLLYALNRRGLKPGWAR